MPLRVAVVGAGLMGRWHARAATRLGAEVAAIVDTDRRAAELLITQFAHRAAAYEGLAECLAECEVDVVHVCAPLAAHVPLVQMAIAAGRHVLVEKPLAHSVRETEAILEAAGRAGVYVIPVHQFPFQRGVRRLFARRDELGELVRIAYRASSAGGIGLSAEGRRALLTEILPHPASLFHQFVPSFDPAAVEVVAATGEELALRGRQDSTQLDVFITLRGRPPVNELHLTGTRASAFADLFHGYSIVERTAASGRGKAARPFALGSKIFTRAAVNAVQRVARWEPAYPGLRELIRAFYASVATGGAAPISEAEIRASAVLAEIAKAEKER
jgi:predicted dehydrogenase